MKRTLILASALIVGGCGDTTVSHDLEARRAFVGLDDAELFTVEPALELLGVDAVSDTVEIHQLLLNIDRISLNRGANHEDIDAPGPWLDHRRDRATTLRGVQPIELSTGTYQVGLDFAPATVERRLAGELRHASVVLRGRCLVLETEEEESYFNHGHEFSGNPVPMPARTGNQRVRWVPFSISTSADFSVAVSGMFTVDENHRQLDMQVDVERWMREGIRPLISAAAAQQEPGDTVELTFETEQSSEEEAAMRLAVESSLAGALSARGAP